MKPGAEYVDVVGAARIVGCGQMTIRTAIRNGALRAATINERGDLRIHCDWIREWMSRKVLYELPDAGGLSTRAYNCLVNSGIVPHGSDAIRSDVEKHLERLRAGVRTKANGGLHNLGQKTLTEIEAWLGVEFTEARCPTCGAMLAKDPTCD